jgi:ubiquinone/menaquinone biosynthesis C-methylase UbiE
MLEMIEVRASQTAIRRAYNLFSLFYGSTFGRLEQKILLQALERVAVEPSARVLEVGVGSGAAFARLRARQGAGGFLVGVDMARGMLRATRRKVPDARLVEADSFALPFSEDSFDLLWASYLLDLIPTGRLEELLQEFRRVMRPGAQLLLVDMSKQGEGMTWWERAYQRVPAGATAWLFGACRPIQALPYVQRAGFQEVRREFVPSWLASEIITARK